MTVRPAQLCAMCGTHIATEVHCLLPEAATHASTLPVALNWLFRIISVTRQWQ